MFVATSVIDNGGNEPGTSQQSNVDQAFTSNNKSESADCTEVENVHKSSSLVQSKGVVTRK